MSDQQPTSPAPVTVRLASLVLDGSPRLDGEDELHVRLLAEAGAELPPILVHRPTMRVIDGMHRVRAAMLRGQAVIRAVYFDGDASAAFVQAVVANVSHGLPLTRADRRAAAARILELHAEWSDRAIAAATGLSPVTVRTIRDRASDGSVRLNTRLGRDGRVRPLDASQGRRRAADVLADRPDASLREVARSAGVSVGTARDVRRRILDGEDPVPRAGRRAGTRSGVARHEPARPPGADPVCELRIDRPVRDLRPPTAILAGLKLDPSLRYSERGRSVLRWLDSHLVSAGDYSQIAEAVPPHCAYPIAELAAGCARAWARISEELRAQGAPARR